jgi:hypothetical protein
MKMRKLRDRLTNSFLIFVLATTNKVLLPTPTSPTTKSTLLLTLVELLPLSATTIAGLLTALLTVCPLVLPLHPMCPSDMTLPATARA